jgi:hypothetical protein
MSNIFAIDRLAVSLVLIRRSTSTVMLSVIDVAGTPLSLSHARRTNSYKRDAVGGIGVLVEGMSDLNGCKDSEPANIVKREVIPETIHIDCVLALYLEDVMLNLRFVGFLFALTAS